MTASLEIDVTIECPDWADRLPAAAELGVRAARAAFAAGGIDIAGGEAEASLVLADDGFVRQLNRQYRDQDKATNVLSFASLDDPSQPSAGGPVLLGDIVVALETVAAESAGSGKSLADHFCHLVVHGMLHLLGFDHQSEAQAQRMERLEIRILRDLGIADPYAETPEGLI